MGHDIRPTPGELTEARSVIDVVLDAADRELEALPASMQVGIGWATDATTADAFGGAYSMCHAPHRITVQFNATVDEWTDAVMTATARGVGRAWLHGHLPDQRLAFRWQVVLAEAAGIALADRIAPAVTDPWTPKAALATEWDSVRDALGDAVRAGEGLATSDDIAYPLASLGAQLAESSPLEDLPEMTRSDVEAALKSRFDDE